MSRSQRKYVLFYFWVQRTDNPTTQSRHASSAGKSGVYWQISLCEAAVYNPRLCMPVMFHRAWSASATQWNWEWGRKGKGKEGEGEEGIRDWRRREREGERERRPSSSSKEPLGALSRHSRHGTLLPASLLSFSHSNTGVVTSSTTVLLQLAVKTHSFPSQLFLSTSSIQTVMVQLDPYEEFVGWNLWTGLSGRGTTGAAQAELIRNWVRIGMFNHHEGYSSRACSYFID